MAIPNEPFSAPAQSLINQILNFFTKPVYMRMRAFFLFIENKILKSSVIVRTFGQI